ncbi:tRNA 2-selenouridine synthase [bioreactor metagenome]|uniref:tRNA 2-selenouridine synthase n=1 Tax=bioreactor metagenome TaxID=1076179 RepID=A0A645AAT9_9ZZZZ
MMGTLLKEEAIIFELVNMLHKMISLEDTLKLDNIMYIDMRSPNEFEMGHIPGAVNIPLFSNEERAEVGTIYKNTGTEEAKMKGLAIVSTKLPELVSQVRSLHKKGSTVVVYCWRGGMRSKSIVTILEIMGITAYQLLGGYKAYRRHVLDSLEKFNLVPPIVVLCGSTGVGKTILLNKLHKQGIPVIDLEALANHRGSAFGQVGLGKSATAQNFDANLLERLQLLSTEPYIVVECESKRVGNVYLPEVLYNAMQKGTKILVKASTETRIQRLIAEYAGIYDDNYESIMASIKTLSKRLGIKKAQKLIQDFSQGKTHEVVGTLLVDYYDPLYGYETCDPADYGMVIDAENLDQTADYLISYLNQQFRR